MSINNGNNDIISTSKTKRSLTSCKADQFKKLCREKTRKRNSPEVHYDSSCKTVRDDMNVNFKRKRTLNTDHLAHNLESDSGKRNQKNNLLTQLLNKDKDGDTVLHLSIVQNEEQQCKYIIKIMTGNLDVVNKLQQTPLHLSVITCQPVLVGFLIFHGAGVNIPDRNGQTALHLASQNADIECVKAIKHATQTPRYSSEYEDEKPDLTLKNFEGKAAFHLAVLSGSEEIAKTLLDMNADINIQDGTCGRTALHLTVESHNINMINFLLKNGANVNATTFSGNTALHLASGLGMDQLVQLLIRNGANINITNIEGDTPLYNKIATNIEWKSPRKRRTISIRQSRVLQTTIR